MKLNELIVTQTWQQFIKQSANSILKNVLKNISYIPAPNQRSAGCKQPALIFRWNWQVT